MNNEVATTEKKPLSVIGEMAQLYGMERAAFESVIKNTVMPAKDNRGNPIVVSNEEFVAFLSVAKEYKLNPLIKEIYAFPGKGGGIQPIVSIDGWLKMLHSNPGYDGLTTTENYDADNKFISVTCSIHHKDRTHPTVITESLAECEMNTDPWKKKPKRMLRHKATIQCARYSFGFAGIMDEDEYDHMKNVTPVENNEKLQKAFLKKDDSKEIVGNIGSGSHNKG